MVRGRGLTGGEVASVVAAVVVGLVTILAMVSYSRWRYRRKGYLAMGEGDRLPVESPVDSTAVNVDEGHQQEPARLTE
ncbi:hypothetical protein ASZ78_012626 [Callipepla squamata]|uniref:Uncharacterized protein n=1 Tax=Callipepla squamata TaxID=9009 RepID=A0A226MWJ7_CALSU|nr:hypothetical protein ASZ78_012626 [Callipepla squamata]